MGDRFEEAQLIYTTEQDSVNRIVRLLRAGNIIVLPCDTIYGLSGLYQSTLSQLRTLKMGSGEQQFAVLATMEQAKRLCKVPEVLEQHWPCPLTAILEEHEGDGKIAIRVPSDPLTIAILEALGSPIYSTAANERGFAITHINDIIFMYKERVQAIVVNPDKMHDTPSTLIDCTTEPYTLLRCGVYDASSLLF
ncbi:MAG: L-threonylcarbamoyladenylate synthase [Sphaerochaeta sp.]|uniref:L-threonylcarbamoyladenylate synthase n=1 Tax=Sphaerochaeta sp. TaxID=1972642 RepID=UPI002FC9D952